VENFHVDKFFAETHPRLRPGPYVHIAVADTGCGMDQATIDRMFEPFSPPSHRAKAPGWACPSCTASWKATTVSSRFIANLARARCFIFTSLSIRGPKRRPQRPLRRRRTQRKRILYVDDEAPLAKLGQKTLEQLGYEVEMTTNVAEALEWVRKEPKRFDLVITDQTMPGLTGMDFAAQLLKIRPDLPIILTTGYSPYLTNERVRAAGIRDLLLKPHTLHTLGVAVHHALMPRKPE